MVVKSARNRWLTGRAILFHFLVVVFVTVCLLAGRWQLHVALGGNKLSWAYTVEWPVFAVIAVVAWWHLIHEEPEEREARAQRASRAAALEAMLDLVPAENDISVSRFQRTGEVTESDESPEVFAARVAAAAREELSSHVARLADTDEVYSAWRKRDASS